MRTTSLLVGLLLKAVAGEKEKFRLSEDCVHKHPNHDAINIPELLALTSNHTLFVSKNRPKELKGETKLSKDFKKELSKLLKAASTSCNFTSKHKLFAFVINGNEGEATQMYLLEHDKKREKRIKSAKKNKILYDIKKAKIGKPDHGSRLAIKIPVIPLAGNTAKLSKNFQPFMLESLALNSHCAANELFDANIKKTTKKYIEFEIKKYNEECHESGYNFKFLSTSGTIERLIEIGKPKPKTNGKCPKSYTLIDVLTRKKKSKLPSDWCDGGASCIRNKGEICVSQEDRKCMCPETREGECCETLAEVVETRGNTDLPVIPAVTTPWAVIGLSIFIIVVFLFGMVVYQCFNQRRQAERRNYNRNIKNGVHQGIVAPLPRRSSGTTSGLTQSSRHEDVLSNSNSNATDRGFLHESLNHGDFDKTIRKPNWYGNKPSHMPGSGMNNGLFHPNQSVVSDETTLPNISQIQQDQSRSRKPVIFSAPSDENLDQEKML